MSNSSEHTDSSSSSDDNSLSYSGDNSLSYNTSEGTANKDYDGGRLKRKKANKTGSRVNSSYSSELDKLDKFDKSTHSSEKQTQIRKMAKILSKVLGITGDIDTMSISDIQKKVKATVPNNPKAWRVQNDKQHELCLTLAHAVNAVAGRDVISTKLPTSEICDKSADFINSLFTGMNSEFITISRDVKERVEAIETLLKLLESGRSKIEVSSNKMQVTDPEFKPLLRLMDEVIKELNFQLSHLRNILNVSVMPTETGLMALFERQAVLKNFLDRTQSTQPGSQAYGSRLVSVLNSLELVTSATDLVHNALRDIGMSVAEYKKIATYDELESKLLSHLARISKSSPTYIIFDKFYRAADVLRRNDYRRESISKAIAGGFESTGGYDGGAKNKSKKRRLKKGGDDKMYEADGAVKNEYSVNPSERISKLEKTREDIVETYVTKLEGKFDQFFTAVDRIAMKFGTTVKLNKELDKFIDALSELIHLPSLRDDTTDKASSFVKNVLGMENQVYEVGKDVFISKLEKIKTTLKAVSGDTKDALTEISNIVEFTDEVYDLIRTTFKIKAFEPTKFSGGRAKKISVFTHKELEDFISGLRRRVFTARIKENFKMIDTTVFNKEYENMLGKFMAAKKQRYTDATDKLTKGIGDIKLEEIKNKVQVLLAVEAIDLYLGYFSDTLIKNPEDIQDILKLIEPLKQIKKNNMSTTTNMDKLKNFLALFIYIGEKFGGVNLRDKIPLSPKLLYKYLCKWKEINHTESSDDNFMVIDHEIDIIYNLTLQSMIGKILACIEGYSTIYARIGSSKIDSTVRLLVGAGSENINIIDDAFEGYIKIPLLIEFYRNVFYDDMVDNYNFSILPKSTSGLVPNLINTIFKLGENPVYTNEEIKIVILEVNSLYNSCTSDDKFREMLYMIVNDMNFRYSIYNKETIEKYKSDGNEPLGEIDKFPHTKNSAAHLLEDNGRLDGEPYMPSSKFSKSTGKSTTEYLKNNIEDDNKLVENFISKIRNAINDIDVGTHGYFKTEYLLKVFKDKKTKDDKFDFIKKTIQTGSNIEEHSIRMLFIDNYIKRLILTLDIFTNIDYLIKGYDSVLSLINLKLVSYENTNGKIHWDVSNFIEYIDYLYKLCDKTSSYIDTNLSTFIMRRYNDIMSDAKNFKKNKTKLIDKLNQVSYKYLNITTTFNEDTIYTILQHIQGTNYFAKNDEFISQMIAVSYNKKFSDVSVFDSEGKVPNVITGGGPASTTPAASTTPDSTPAASTIPDTATTATTFTTMPSLESKTGTIHTSKDKKPANKNNKLKAEAKTFVPPKVPSTLESLSGKSNPTTTSPQPAVLNPSTLGSSKVDIIKDTFIPPSEQNKATLDSLSSKKKDKNPDIFTKLNSVVINSNRLIGEKNLANLQSIYFTMNGSDNNFKKFNADIIRKIFREWNKNLNKISDKDKANAFKSLDNTINYSLLYTITDKYDDTKFLQIALEEYITSTLKKTNPNNWVTTIDSFIENNITNCSKILLDVNEKQECSNILRTSIKTLLKLLITEIMDYFKKIEFYDTDITEKLSLLTFNNKNLTLTQNGANYSSSTVFDINGINTTIIGDFINYMEIIIENYSDSGSYLHSLIHLFKNINHLEIYYNIIDIYSNDKLKISETSKLKFKSDINNTINELKNKENKLFFTEMYNSIDDIIMHLTKCTYDIEKVINYYLNIPEDARWYLLYTFYNAPDRTIFNNMNFYYSNASYYPFLNPVKYSQESFDCVLNHLVTKINEMYYSNIAALSNENKKTLTNNFKTEYLKVLNTENVKLESDIKKSIDAIIKIFENKPIDFITLVQFIVLFTGLPMNNVLSSFLIKLTPDYILTELYSRIIEYYTETYNYLSNIFRAHGNVTENISNDTKLNDYIKIYMLDGNDTIHNKLGLLQTFTMFLSQRRSETLNEFKNKQKSVMEFVFILMYFMQFNGDNTGGYSTMFTPISDPTFMFIMESNLMPIFRRHSTSIFKNFKYTEAIISNYLNLPNAFVEYFIQSSDIFDSQLSNITLDIFNKCVIMNINDVIITNNNNIWNNFNDLISDIYFEVATFHTTVYNETIHREIDAGNLYNLAIYDFYFVINPKNTPTIKEYNENIDNYIKRFGKIEENCDDLQDDINAKLKNFGNSKYQVNKNAFDYTDILDITFSLLESGQLKMENDDITNNSDTIDITETGKLTFLNNYYKTINRKFINNSLAYKSTSTTSGIKGGKPTDTIIILVNSALEEEGILDINIIDLIINMLKSTGLNETTGIHLLTTLQNAKKNTVDELYKALSNMSNLRIRSNVYDVRVNDDIEESIPYESNNVISVISWFNSFLYSYIGNIFDKNSEVVYGKLLMDFTNAASYAVYNGKGFSRGGKNVNNENLTKKDEAAYYDYTIRDPIDVRTALVLRRIMKEKDTKGTILRWIVQNTADMTTYYKDRLRMVLPYYQTNMNLFIEHCKFLRENIISFNYKNNTRTKFTIEILVAQLDTYYPEVKFFMPDTKGILDNINILDYFSKVLTKFENYAKILITGMKTTLRDLDDSIVFGNTYYDSINDYINVNDVEPLILLNPRIVLTPSIMSPNSLINSFSTSPEFKFLYMMKSINYEKYDLSRTHQILNLFNSVNSTSISKELFEEIQRVILIETSFNTNVNFHIPKYGSFEEIEFPETLNHMTRLIELFESTNQIKTITQEKNKLKTRKEIIKNTVAELNINPVNLKALTRNIPLANIYRYADLVKLYDASNTDDPVFLYPSAYLDNVLLRLRIIIKRALDSQEMSNTREGIMAIYDE